MTTMIDPGCPFQVNIPDSDIAELKSLITAGKFPRSSYENSQVGKPFGVSTKWMRETTKRWTDDFSWKKTEEYINRFPQWIKTVTGKDGYMLDMHYVSLGSSNEEAIPVLLLHGWPGSFLELLEMGEILSQPQNNQRPLQIIIPSLPGYAFSSAPPLGQDFDVDDAAFVLDGLMVGLGFAKENGGYVAHGGDLGGIIASILAAKYDNCNAAHINFIFLQESPDGTVTSPEELDEFERGGLERTRKFFEKGTAYAQIQATRPSTLGFMLSSSPIALLAWVGEKFLTEGQPTMALEKILENITLWWFTNTFPTSIWHYRHLFPPEEPLPYIHKPLGVSCFPGEVVLPPRRWIEAQGNLIYYKRHASGGHFAALEKPEELSEDLIEFVRIVY